MANPASDELVTVCRFDAAGGQIGRETWPRTMESNNRSGEFVRYTDYAALLARLEAEKAAREKAEAERDEAVNWTATVEKHGTDKFDDLAEAWLALPAIQRVTNAVTSVFAKWADQGMMDRFRKHQHNMFQMAYVEGCLAGVKASEAERDRLAAVVAEAWTNLETVQRTIATKAPVGAPWAHEAMSMLSAMLGDRHAVTGEVKTHPAIKDDAARAWQKHGEAGAK